MENFKKLFLLFTALCLLLPAILSAQMTWTCANASAPWAPRSCNTVLAFRDSIWLMGGVRLYPDTVGYNDVWKSADGQNWALATAAAAWSPRDNHSSVVFHDSMWVMGGLIPDTPYVGSDIWCSADGVRWIRAVDSAPWGPRAGSALVVFRDTIWLTGGGYWNGGPPFWTQDDIWKSGDGHTWFCVDSAAQWGPIAGHTSVVFRDSMWLMGGCDWIAQVFSHVWKTGDGVNWLLVTDAALWGPKYTHGSVVFNDKMWVMGGWRIFPQRRNDVWFSTDGENWTCADTAEWPPRGHMTAVVHDSRMWVMAGDTSAGLYTGSNDVWFSYGLGIEERSTPNAEYVTPNATIVRGVLLLPPASSVMHRASSVLIDITGRKVMDLHSGANNIRHLAPGVYFIRRNNNNQVTKIIVTR